MACEATGMICFREVPFQDLIVYDIENSFIPKKWKYTYKLTNDKFESLPQKNKYENPNDHYCCQHSDRD